MSKQSVKTNPNFNMGNVSEQYAKNISPSVHTAWRHHNAALILVDKLRPLCKFHLKEGSYCKNGIAISDLLQFVINVPDTNESKTYTRRLRDIVIDTVLDSNSSDKMIRAKLMLYLSHLNKISPLTLEKFVPGQILKELQEVL